MKRGRKVPGRMLVLVILLAMVLAAPVSAKTQAKSSSKSRAKSSSSSVISSKCKKAYKKLLKKGEFTYSASAKYWNWFDEEKGSYANSVPDSQKVYRFYTKTAVKKTYKITGFRVLNVDRKGQPELILRVVEQTDADAASSSDAAQSAEQTPYIAVGYYKNGKVKFATDEDDPTVIAFRYTKDSSTYTLSNTISKFYYSKSAKALYSERGSDSAYMVSRRMDILKNGKMCTSKYAYHFRNEMDSMRGYDGYTILNGEHQYDVYMGMTSAYKKYIKKNFKGIKGYKFYAPTATNIAKKVKE